MSQRRRRLAVRFPRLGRLLRIAVAVQRKALDLEKSEPAAELGGTEVVADILNASEERPNPKAVSLPRPTSTKVLPLVLPQPSKTGVKPCKSRRVAVFHYRSKPLKKKD